MPALERETKTIRIRRIFGGRLGSGLLSDSVKISEQGKLDCYGIFTIFYAWAYPCNRSWSIVVTVFELSKGTTPITITLKRDSDVIKELATATIKNKEQNGVSTFSVPLKYRFDTPGTYILECALRNRHNRLRIPFEVRTKGWPEFTEKEIGFAKGNPAIPQSLRANVHCEKCEHAYIFEETFLSDLETKGGIFRFPGSGKFECLECNHTLELRDIQGQLRESLKNIISQSMRAKS